MRKRPWRNAVDAGADDAKARAWYQRAMELGSSEAKRALVRMATQ
jgi:TPR repeat protein